MKAFSLKFAFVCILMGHSRPHTLLNEPLFCENVSDKYTKKTY